MSNDTTPAKVRMNGRLGALAVRYLRWRYGGNVAALKPPLGYSRFVPRTLWYRVAYQCWLKPRWQLDRWIFNRYGQPMRDAWSALQP